MPKPADVVLLAIETYLAGPKAVDNTKDQTSAGWSGDQYNLRTWAVDVISKLPEDRERARQIVEAHHKDGWELLDNTKRRRIGQYCGQFYRRLRDCGLMQAGERFLKQID
jgi:hypothetical protein